MAKSKSVFSGWTWLVIVCAAVMWLAGAAAAKPSVVVIRFTPESGTKAETWTGYSLGHSLSGKFARIPETRIVRESYFQGLWKMHGRPWPGEPSTDKELEEFAYWGSLTNVVMGSYGLNSGVVRIRCRIWSRSGIKKIERSIPVTDLYARMGPLATDVARECGWSLSPKSRARLARQDLNNARSFELFGRICQASDQRTDGGVTAWANELQRIDPKSPMAVGLVGWARFRKPKEAIHLLKTAAQMDPGDYRTWEMLGDACGGARDAVNAEQAYRTASAGDPSDPEILCSWANTEHRLGHQKQSNGLFARAMAECAGWPDQLEVARYLFYYNRYDDAVAALRGALKRGAPVGLASWQLGYVYESKSDHSKALPCIQDAVAAMPDSAELRYALANLYYTERRLGEAEHQLLATLDLDPGYKDAHTALACVYEVQGRPLLAGWQRFLAKRNVPRMPTWLLPALSPLVAIFFMIVILIIRRVLRPAEPYRGTTSQ